MNFGKVVKKPISVTANSTQILEIIEAQLNLKFQRWINAFGTTAKESIKINAIMNFDTGLTFKCFKAILLKSKDLVT